jgi:outer membrane protein assembly factor BamA
MLGLSVKISCGMLFVIHFLAIFYFFTFCTSIMGSDGAKSYLIAASDEQLEQKLHEMLPQQFFVSDVQYLINGSYDLDELRYLTGLSAQTTATHKDLQNALFYLQQSLKFSSINLEIIEKSKKYTIVFQLIKQQILHRMAVSGFLRGKDRLKNSYLIDIGDPFDEQKHQHGIDQMVHFLKDAGYFQAQVFDTVTIDPQTQAVVVKCFVKKGLKFKVRTIQIKFDHVGSVSSEEIDKLQQRIKTICIAKLQGKCYSSQLIQSLLQKTNWVLSHHGCIGFDVTIEQQVVPERKDVDLTVHVNLERKKEFVFWGATFFKTEQIVDHLLLYGKSTWHFPSSLIVDEIEQLYKGKGFWDVHVSVREEKDRVYCFIQEGPRAVVSNIVFKNNEPILETVLLKNACRPLLRARHFDQDLFKKMQDQIIKMYKQFGFWDVKILKEEFVDGEKSDTHELILTMDPGAQKKLGTIVIADWQEVQQQLQTMYEKNKGQGFDPAWLAEQKQVIVRFLRNQGYQKITVQYSLQEHDGLTDVVWNVDVSEACTKVGKTIILGNSKISHKLLMQEFVHKDGEFWDKKNLEKTLQNFKTLPIFDSVQIYPGQQNDANLCKPVLLKLIEDDRYEIKTRFGLQQVGRNLQLRRGFTYQAGATLCLKNPFQQADQCLFEGDMTRFYRNISASYLFPWLFGKKIGCQWKAYDNAYQQPVYIGSQDCLYKATQQGFLCNLTHTRDNKKLGQFVLSGSLGFEAMGLYECEQPELNLIIDYERYFLDKKIGYIFVEPNVVWQKVDNLLNPHRGHMSFFSCKAMLDLDSKTSFFKVLVEHAQYVPFGDKVVVAVRARLGHVFNRCFDQINPIERFYLGGAQTLRGYERDYTPPYGVLTKPIYDQHAGLPPCADNLWRYAPQGGRSLFNLNAEVRFNLYKNFGVVVFNDVGALFKQSIYDELRSWKDHFFAGSGFGLRYDTPIGPARFDVGYKWKIQYPDFESRCVWYLTLGQAF